MRFEEELKKFDKTIIKLSHDIKPLLKADVEQELRLHLFIKWQKQKKPIKSFKNWAYIVCKRKLIDINRYYRAKKRDCSQDISLEALLEQENKGQ